MAAPSQLADWANFYVIVGSSAGALTGLQFVVIALITEAEAARSMLEIRAFGTPTIVHFCVVLLISGLRARRGTRSRRLGLVWASAERREWLIR